MSASESPWFLFRDHRPDAALRLFCFPWAGVGASVYHSWQRALAPAVDVLGIQLPGRETRLKEPPFSSLEPLVAGLVPALVNELDQRPFAFLGYSLGALVAFETARELRRLGAASPAALFLCAKPAPHRPKLHSLPEDPTDEALLDWIREVYAPPEDAWRVPELMRIMLPILRADLSVFDRYVHREEPPLDVPIHAFGGETDHATPVSRLRAWQELTTAEFRARLFPGGHFFVLRHEPALQRAVGRAISRLLIPS